jgi:DNA polymerase-3 subunit delta
MTETLSACYLIVGDDPFLIEEATKSVLSGTTDLSISEFESEHEVSSIIQAARTPSMFGDRRILLLRHAESLTAAEQREIVAYLEDPAPDATLVLVSSKKLPKLAEATKKVGRVIEAAKGRRSDLFGWLRSEAKKKGLNATGDALGALVETVGEERMALANALDELKLALGSGSRFDDGHVRKQFSGQTNVKIFGFIDAVANRQLGSALEMLHRLVSSGESPQGVYWMLTRHFRMLLAAGGSSGSVAKALGIPAWRAEKLVKQARGFTEQELIAAYQALAAADHNMKTSHEPELLTLERAVVKIAG